MASKRKAEARQRPALHPLDLALVYLFFSGSTIGALQRLMDESDGAGNIDVEGVLRHVLETHGPVTWLTTREEPR